MQYLRSYFFAALLTATCFFSVQAQETVITEEPATPIREIGFGTNIILGPIFSSGSAPLDLMYRWGSKNRVYRIGTSLAYRTSTNYWDNADQKRKDYYFRADVFLGREWRTEVAKRWLVNFGGDIVFNTSQQNYRNESTSESEEITRLTICNNHTMRIGGGLRPFVGIMFKINDRLLIGTEASFFAGIQNNTFSSERYTMVNGVRDNTNHNYDREESNLDINIRTQPASNIFVYYRF